jgi:hypothetical protein
MGKLMKLKSKRVFYFVTVIGVILSSVSCLLAEQTSEPALSSKPSGRSPPVRAGVSKVTAEKPSPFIVGEH